MDDIEPVFDRLERNLPLRDRTRGGKRSSPATATLTESARPKARLDLTQPAGPVIDLTDLNDEIASAGDLSSAPAGSAAEARVAATAATADTGDRPDDRTLDVSARDATTPGRPGRWGRIAVAGAAVVVAARLLRRRR